MPFKRGEVLLVLFPASNLRTREAAAPPSSFKAKVLGAHASCVLLPREEPNSVILAMNYQHGRTVASPEAVPYEKIRRGRGEPSMSLASAPKAVR